MTRPLESLTDALAARRRRAGADAADALAVDGTSLSIDIRAGKLEQAERSEGIELGLRVLVGQAAGLRVGLGHLGRDDHARVAERAVAMAREAPEDPCVGPCRSRRSLRGTGMLAALELADDAPEPAAAALEEDARARRGGRDGRDRASRRSRPRRAMAAAAMHLAAVERLCGRLCAHLAVVLGGGLHRRGHRDGAGLGRRKPHLPGRPARAEEVGPAGRRTGAAAASARASRGPAPIRCCMTNGSPSSLIGHLLGAVNGSAIARGASWARDLLGEQVLPDALSVIEDPHRPRISGSRPFDAEGLATRAAG